MYGFVLKDVIYLTYGYIGTLPTPTFDVDSEEVICSPTQSQQLKLQKTLIPSTFGVFDECVHLKIYNVYSLTN